MNTDIYLTVATTLLGILTSVLAVFTFIKNDKKKDADKSKEQGNLEADIRQIKETVTDIKKDQKEHEQIYQKILVEQGRISENVNNLKERVVVLEKKINR